MSNAALWVGLVILAFAGILFQQALTYDYFGRFGPGPGLFPLWLSGTLGIITVIYIVASYREKIIRIADIVPRGTGRKRVIALFAALLIFLVAVRYTGYTVASAVMLFILLVREYKWYTSVGIAAAIAGTVFYVFKSILDVPLPVNPFGF
jgi:hypothetical protein